MKAFEAQYQKIDRLSRTNPEKIEMIVEEVEAAQRASEKLMEPVEPEDDAHNDNGLAYNDINFWAYYAITTILYGLIVLLACTVDKVALVFDFIGCVTVVLLSFVIPSVFYLKARKTCASKIGPNQEVTEADDAYLMRCSYV